MGSENNFVGGEQISIKFTYFYFYFKLLKNKKLRSKS